MKKYTKILLILIVVGLILIFTEKAWAPRLTSEPGAAQNPNSTATEHIIFPAGGETLTAGQTYLLKWSGGPAETQIFLIDTSTLSVGLSVSIVDRVYHLANTGTYNYTIPLRLKTGVYELEIGDQMSNTFNIMSATAR